MARRLSHVPAERAYDGPFDPPPQQYGAFSVPSLSEGAPYIDNPAGGWAPPVYRIPLQQDVTDMRTDPDSAPQETWRPRDADKARRHSVEDQDADGWQEQKGYKKWAPNPRSTPPPEDRPTMKMAPTRYSFTRPFDQMNRIYGDAQVGSARQLNGQHFSMADNKREYPILGMEPARRSRRNTFRLMPAPWDSNIVDLPPETAPMNGRIRSVEVPRENRTYRLG